MEEFLDGLKRFLFWLIPTVIKIALTLAILIVSLAMLPIWLAFGMPGLRGMQGLALLYAIWPKTGTPQPRKQKPLRDHSIDGSGQYRICAKCGERSLVESTNCRRHASLPPPLKSA